MCGCIKILVLRRRDPNNYGQTVRASCACDQVTTNWHTSEQKARQAYSEKRADLAQRGQ